MIEYTKEEYKRLLLIVRARRMWFADLLTQTIENGPSITYTSLYGGIQKKYSSLKRLLSLKYPNKFHLMYVVSFNDLPLYINESGVLNQMILKWRLSIGK